MKTLLSFVVTVCLVFVGLTINANTQKYAISGFCLENSTHQGISGVQIDISRPGSTTVYSDMTDVSGWYSISVPANFSYTVKATLDGGIQSQTTGILSSDERMDAFYWD